MTIAGSVRRAETGGDLTAADRRSIDGLQQRPGTGRA
jgi:hypothetical protein